MIVRGGRASPRWSSDTPAVWHNTVQLYGIAMHFLVRVLRYHGRVLPWRDVINQPPLQGDLRVEERLDDALRRYVRIARQFDSSNTRPDRVLPELDARLVVMSPQAFTLTGFERIDGVAYAQSWLVGEQ